MFIGQSQFFISQVYLNSIWQIMSELHCTVFFIGLFLVGYFIFRFKITLSFNCIGGQHRWKFSPLAAFNMVLFKICFNMRFHSFK